MSIETFGNGDVVVTGADIQIYRLLAIQKGLKFQAQAGLKSRFNVPQQARDILLRDRIELLSRQLQRDLRRRAQIEIRTNSAARAG